MNCITYQLTRNNEQRDLQIFCVLKKPNNKLNNEQCSVVWKNMTTVSLPSINYGIRLERTYFVSSSHHIVHHTFFTNNKFKMPENLNHKVKFRSINNEQ